MPPHREGILNKLTKVIYKNYRSYDNNLDLGQGRSCFSLSPFMTNFPEVFNTFHNTIHHLQVYFTVYTSAIAQGSYHGRGQLRKWPPLCCVM